MKQKVKDKAKHLDNQKVRITVDLIESEIENCMTANVKTPGRFKTYENSFWQSDYSESTLNEVLKEIQKAGYNVSLEHEPMTRKRLQFGGGYLEQDDVFYTLTVRFDEE